jgi:hypothetical protein
MTDYTTEQLIDQVAALFGKKVPGESLSAIDETVINGQIDSALESVEDIISVDRNEIPGRFFQALSDLVALYCGPHFSQLPMSLAERHASVEACRKELRKLAAGTVTYEPQKATYY